MTKWSLNRGGELQVVTRTGLRRRMNLLQFTKMSLLWSIQSSHSAALHCRMLFLYLDCSPGAFPQSTEVNQTGACPVIPGCAMEELTDVLYPSWWQNFSCVLPHVASTTYGSPVGGSLAVTEKYPKWASAAMHVAFKVRRVATWAYFGDFVRHDQRSKIMKNCDTITTG